MGHFKSLLSVVLLGGLVACSSSTTLSERDADVKDDESVNGPLTADELAEVADLQLQQKSVETEEPVSLAIDSDQGPQQAVPVPELEQEVSHQDDQNASALSEPEPASMVEPAKPAPSVTVAIEENQILFGSLEWAYLPGVNKSFVAEVDPQIDLSLIRVTDMRVFERNGKEWISFSFADNTTSSEPNEMNLPVAVWLEKRPVVITWVQVGELRDRISFVLMKKQPDQDEAIVLGKNFLNDKVVVDPGRQYTQAKK